MPPSNLLTREDLLFLKKVEGLSLFFDKLTAAKVLIGEAKAQMTGLLKIMSKKPIKTKASKVLRKTRTKPISFGVDLPKELTAHEHTLLELIKKGPLSKKDIMEKTKLKRRAIDNGLDSLKRRKLAKARGNTITRVWEAT